MFCTGLICFLKVVAESFDCPKETVVIIIYSAHVIAGCEGFIAKILLDYVLKFGLVNNLKEPDCGLLETWSAVHSKIHLFCIVSV